MSDLRLSLSAHTVLPLDTTPSVWWPSLQLTTTTSPTAGLLCDTHLVLSAGSRWAGFSLRLGLPLVLSGLCVSLCGLVLLAVWVILLHKVWLFPIPTRLRHTYRNTDNTPTSADWRSMATADARWPRRIGVRCGQGHGLTYDAGTWVRRKQDSKAPEIAACSSIWYWRVSRGKLALTMRFEPLRGLAVVFTGVKQEQWGLVHDAGPSAEAPPSKCPRVTGRNPFEPQVGAMSAYTSNVNLRALLWANNSVTINNLEEELQHQSSCGWMLNDWDIPVCDDDAECSICDAHTDHFVARLSRADDDNVDEAQGGSSAEEDEQGRNDSASPGSDSESEEVQEKSVLMKKLLRLRDLRARERAYKSDEPDNLQGMMSLIDEEKDTLHKSLQSLTQAHNELQTRHKAALDEIEVLKQQLSTMSAVPTSLPEAVSAIPASLPLAVSAIPTNPPVATPVIPTFSHAEWLAMKMPPPSTSPQLLACWLQCQEHTGLNGVHVCGPHWDIDLRDLRGYREVMSRVPEMRKTSGSTDRHNHQHCIFAILGFLAIPGRYAELLHADKCAVANQVQYSPLSLQQGPMDLAVSRLLAAQGLTVPVADNAWQYAYRYIKSVAEDQSVHNARTDSAQKLLANAKVRLRYSPPPVGLKSLEEDRFQRPSDLPNKHL
ncbi:hypothetical protein K438DRAFT_1773040 [Mycena galopus ATCC 62051]|nr:hypothetical protein K438DRAFT_1773040 [Mycena galopus ATCC 62051]